MTVEEIDIVVEVKIQDLLKEFKKSLPAIKKQLSEIQNELHSIDIKKIKLNVNMSQVKKEVQKVKKQIKEAFKEANISDIGIKEKSDNTRKTKENSKNAPKISKAIEEKAPISEVQQEENTTVKQSNSINKENEKNNKKGVFSSWFSEAKKMVTKLNETFQITSRIKNAIKGFGTGIKNGLGYIVKFAANLFSLQKIYSVLSDAAKSWLSSQNEDAKQLSTNIEYMKYAMGSALSPIIQFITNLVYQMMKAIQSVAYALTGVNIFAKASSKSYASMSKNAKKAKEETKQLAGIHSDINNISDNKSSDSGGESEIMAPSFDLSQMDNQMSEFAQKLYDFCIPLKDSWNQYGGQVIEQMQTTISQLGTLISSVWQSFENVITNGTIYTSLELMLAIIENIARAFTEAWTTGEIGNELVQDLFNTFNHILEIINQIAQSTGFQNMLNSALNIVDSIILIIDNIGKSLQNAFTQNNNGNSFLTNVSSTLETIFKQIEKISKNDGFQNFVKGIADALTGISEFIKPVVEDIMALSVPIADISGSIIGTVLSEVGNALRIIGENEIAVTIVESIAIAIGIMAVVANIGTILTTVLGGIVLAIEAVGVALSILFSPVTLIVAAIAAIVAVIILCIKHFEEVKEIVSNVVEEIKNKITEMKDAIGEKITELWNNLKQGAQDAWEGIKNVFTNVTGWFKSKFSEAWNAVKSVFSKGGEVFAGIKEGIENTFKTIVNGLIDGINKVVKVPFDAINTALRTIKNVEIAGFKPFDFISTISIPQIPHLSTGNVAYEETLAIFGEYSGAKSNPEITAPQNILKETFEDVLANQGLNSDSNYATGLKQLIIQFGSAKVALEMENLLQQARRENGIATVTM